MINFLKKTENLKYLIAVALIAVFVCIAVSNYISPVFGVDKVNEYSLSTEKNTSTSGQRPTFATVLADEKNANQKQKAIALPVSKIDETQSRYKDGTYYGTGVGFDGKITVKVVIKSGKISSINVVSSNDGIEYLAKAKTLLSKIISRQTTNVDAVSGATYSSNGLIEAVRDALKKAAVNPAKQTKNTSKTKSTTESAETAVKKKNTIAKIVNGKFADGVYYGTGEGYKGEIKVKVTIKNGKIKSIETVSSKDDKEFYGKAVSLFKTIVNNQSADVDTVSGATFSSEGILEAVSDALSKAVIETTAATTNVTVTTIIASEDISSSQLVTAVTEPSERKYIDGTYLVQVICEPDNNWDFEPYTMSMNVTVRDDKIIGIKDIIGMGTNYDEYNDWYISRAADGTKKITGVAAQITAKGTADYIDTVSGATCSSKAIIEAVQKALENAKVTGG